MTNNTKTGNAKSGAKEWSRKGRKAEAKKGRAAAKRKAIKEAQG